ncbi:MAG: hypothetical protein IKQ35_02500 [Bacilli bacterium]|nr:hypothetical protein [Bacilli bacterium]
MNTLKKKIIIIALIFVSVFFIDNYTVKADTVKLDNISFECIYSDGSLFNVTWASDDDSQIIVNRDVYNVSGSSSQQAGSTGGINYINPEGVRDSTKNHCSPYVILGQVKDNENDDEESPMTYIKYTSQSGEQFSDSDISQGDSWFLWWKTSDGADQANKNLVEGKLVSESVKIFNTEPDDAVYFKKVTTSSNDPVSYIIVKKYGNFVVLESNGRTTPILYGFGSLSSMADGDVIYVNDPRPQAFNSTSGNSSYTFPAVRFQLSKSATTNVKYKYEKVNSDDVPPLDPSSALCEQYLEHTAGTLRDIIQIVQLLVPALMIVLCGIDLARIVFAGKIEDELPKARKRLIIRLIIGAAFFFVPLVVNLVITMLKESGGENMELIEEIGCLFN